MKKLGRIHKKRGFTLIEMVIVLIIMWILLMATMVLSWDQIQKIKDKTVKESILAEMQSRYSRNLWSSSFAWVMYNHFDVELSTWSNEIFFSYYTWGNQEPFFTGSFVNRFEIKSIISNYDFTDNVRQNLIQTVNLYYTPYNISCRIEWENLYDNIVVLTRVNDSRDYCFEIKQKNCRLIELSEEKCNHLKNILDYK